MCVCVLVDSPHTGTIKQEHDCLLHGSLATKKKFLITQAKQYSPLRFLSIECIWAMRCMWRTYLITVLCVIPPLSRPDYMKSENNSSRETESFRSRELHCKGSAVLKWRQSLHNWLILNVKHHTWRGAALCFRTRGCLMRGCRWHTCRGRGAEITIFSFV